MTAMSGISTANPGRIIVFQVIMKFRTVGLLFRKLPKLSGFHKTCDTESTIRESFTEIESSIISGFIVFRISMFESQARYGVLIGVIDVV
jgi:hypothetical protein